MKYFFLVVVFIIIVYMLFRNRKRKVIIGDFPEVWRKILTSKVRYYIELTENEKKSFDKRIQLFLATTKITGVHTDIDDTIRVLVASSAIIPVFRFPEWEYINLKEVLIYPSSFNDKFEYGKEDSTILGMVGTSYMEGKMILSKPSLISGFSNSRDKKNVGIHEFVHLIDKTDGIIDGVPSALTNNEFALPWLNLLRLKMEEIHSMNSDINPYGGVSKEEFFPVISEYFFERPKLLKSKHPEMYKKLNEIFTVDLAEKYKGTGIVKTPGRNDLCPCGSEKKYKHCCMVL